MVVCSLHLSRQPSDAVNENFIFYFIIKFIFIFQYIPEYNENLLESPMNVDPVS
jgi:hypothetical protein